MRMKLWTLSVLGLVGLGCHSNVTVRQSANIATVPAHFTVITQTGSESKLATNQPINTVLASLPPCCQNPSRSIALLRRGPDGLSREVIDCSITQSYLVAQKNVCLHDGDHLVINSPTTQPIGLARPDMPGIPVAN